MSHVATLVAVAAGALALGRLLAYFAGRTSWMRDLDERIYESPFGLLMPGGWLYRLGRRRGVDGRDWPFAVDGVMGWWAYELGRRRSNPLVDELTGGAMPGSAEELPRLAHVVPVVPSGRRRAVSRPPRRAAAAEEGQP